MKKILLTALSVLGAWGLYAKPVSVTDASKVAVNFLESRKANQTGELTLVKTYVTEGKNCVYAFNNAQGNCFVLVAGDDAVVPVLGYSLDHVYVTPGRENSPEAEYWMEYYSKQIVFAANNNIAATPEITQQWADLLSGSQPTTAAKGTSVQPMLSTEWDQAPNFNDLCPGNAPVGCVATAMAQIMKFWNWPASGTGSHSYNASGYGTQTADFENTEYDWSNMPNKLVPGQFTATEKQAAALLSYHCGVAVNMSYSASSSGAFVISSASPISYCSETAMKNFFKYKTSISGHEREEYNDTDWHTMLTNELDAGRPLLYAGYGSVGGHAFVFDGYNDDGKFHVNWGWDGLGNGYYEVDALNPTFVGVGGGAGQFNDGQQVLIGIEPISSNAASPLFLYENPTPSATQVNAGGNYNISAPIQNGGTEITVNLRCVAIDTATMGANFMQNLYNQSTTFATGEQLTFDANTTINIPSGTYYVAFGHYNANGSMVLLKNSDGNFIKTLLKVNGGTAVDDIYNANSINIYPNPASGIVNVDLSAYKGKMSGYNIVNLLGQVVSKGTVSAGQSTVNISINNLASGNYILQLSGNEEVVKRKITVK